jgi:nucleotide-binding universal stress UspA family protein
MTRALSQPASGPRSWTKSPALEKVRRAAEEAVAKAAAQLGESQPASVTVRAVKGFPARELIEASHDADLLVVGSRGGSPAFRLDCFQQQAASGS